MAAQMLFKDSTRSHLMPELFYQIRKKMSDLRPELPAGLIGPNVNDEYGDVDALLFMVTADGADFAQLKRIAEDMRTELLRVPNVVKVNLYGPAGRAHLRRIQPREARDARHPRAGLVSTAWRGRTAWPPGRRS